MAYSKTNWVDNTTPIDKDNLNKIEQGIYDNSLVVDAVTNTLNPTDTETYKTAELTEGQITDVIGVNDIVIKGDTEQNGTPTPSAPVDVNVVSGSNVINTSNRNLIDKDREISQGATNNSADTARVSIRVKHKLKANTTYTVITNLNTSNFYWAFVLGTKVSPWSNAEQLYDSGWKNTNHWSYTTSQECYINIPIRNSSNTDININDVKDYWFMLYEGAYDSNVFYEPHQGKELPLDLPVENLLQNTATSQTINGVNFTVNEDKSVRVTGTATANAILTINSFNFEEGVAYRLHGCPKGGSGSTYKLDAYGSSGLSEDTGNGISINTSGTRNIRIVIFAGQTVNNLVFKPMIEQGSKANAYTLYGTDPIELCKIGNYQDYFYKSGSKWYLHKEMTFETRTLEDNWQTDIIPQSNPRKFVWNSNHTYIVPANNDTIVTAVCNYPLVSATNTSAGTASGVAIHPNGSFYISADVYNNLNSSPIKMYIPLITPVDTEITDTTLISQLEAIYNAPLYEQTNITQTNNDLPMVLDITACKDNINGIKAFIRK